jgi:outer membrane protein OmpA-like peptidoglycan-associated protein
MNSQKIKEFILLFFFPCFFALFLILGGCSSGLTIQEIPLTANVSQEFNNFNSDMNEAITSQVNILSPKYFMEAQASLNDAKEGLDKQQESKQILHDISRGRAYLKRANEVSSISTNKMEEVVLARKEAIASGAQWSFANEFEIADSQLRNVTSDVEKSNLKSIDKNRVKLHSNYLNLELKGIKKVSLGDARIKIKKAIDEDAKAMAPQSLAIAEKSLTDTDAFITANRHDTREIGLRSQLVNNNADHLLKITEESKKTKKISPEELALRFESNQEKLINEQNDLFTEKNISQSLTNDNISLKNEITNSQNELMVEQSVSESLAVENRELYNQADKNITSLKDEKANTLTLNSEKELNNLFEKARNEFTKDEAEVYKQGNLLTIRLRGLDFSSAKAVLKTSNFPLLGKVQRVIKEFKNSSVVIEGHTDSIGNKTKNAKLSKDRAQAVREYLISIDAIPSTKIEAIGSGEQKPIASNKTPTGRAQNRRVDVLINVDDSSKL